MGIFFKEQIVNDLELLHEIEKEIEIPLVQLTPKEFSENPYAANPWLYRGRTGTGDRSPAQFYPNS